MYSNNFSVFFIENEKRQIRANFLPFLILNKDIKILLEKSIYTKYYFIPINIQ